MNASLVITLIGTDRPGLVNALRRAGRRLWRELAGKQHGAAGG